MNVCIEAVAANAEVVMTSARVVAVLKPVSTTWIVAAAPMLRNLLRSGKSSLSAVAPDFNFEGGTAVA